MNTFIETVKSFCPSESAAAYAWGILVRGAEVGWFREADVTELLDMLRSNGDWISEELGFTFSGDQLRVNLLDDDVLCDPADIVAALAALEARMRA